MFLNGVWEDWQKYLYCYLSGTKMVTIESQWNYIEFYSDQGPGNQLNNKPNSDKNINLNPTTLFILNVKRSLYGQGLLS